MQIIKDPMLGGEATRKSLSDQVDITISAGCHVLWLLMGWIVAIPTLVMNRPDDGLVDVSDFGVRKVG